MKYKDFFDWWNKIDPQLQNNKDMKDLCLEAWDCAVEGTWEVARQELGSQIARLEMAVSYYRAGMGQYGRTDWIKPRYVPQRVLISVNMVRSEIPGDDLIVRRGEYYDVESNQWGAISAITKNGLLGLKPREFEVIEWKLNPFFTENNN